MMLQSEHERCDRVRSSWREVRRLTFAVTTAIKRAKQRENHPDAEVCVETAQGLANKLSSYAQRATRLAYLYLSYVVTHRKLVPLPGFDLCARFGSRAVLRSNRAPR